MTAGRRPRILARCRSLLLATATALAGLSLFMSSALAAQAPTRAQVQRALDRTVAAGAPGAVAVITGPHGRERYSAGLANVRRGTPISPRNHQRVGSITKQFTATVMLQLVAEGKIGLQDSVEKWLPGVVPGGDRITIRELLNMTSGLANYCSVPETSTLCDPPPAEMSRRWTPRQLVDIGVQAPRTFPPGEGWAYTNTNYVLLQMIVERATGNSLGAELRHRIFRPLGLKDTQFAPTRLSIPKPFTHGYDVLGAGSWPPDVTRTSPTVAWGAGAIVSRPGDIQAFERALLGGRLLPPDLLSQMKAPTPGSLRGAPPSQPLGLGTYGLGLFHYTWSHACGAWGHGGDFQGYHSLAVANGNGRRAAAIYVNAQTLDAVGALADREAERLVACRMRFGRIGAERR
jgi:D-alanyl-D-alanine carboxypeptidase